MRRLLLIGLLLGPFTLASQADEKDEKKDKAPTDKKGKSAPATIEVRLPPMAELSFDGAPTTQRGPVRRFITPPLEPGWAYGYKVAARWKSREGKDRDESRDITVQAGKLTRVELLPPKKKDKEDFKDKKKEDTKKDEPKDEDKEQEADFVKLFNVRAANGTPSKSP